MEIDFFVHPEHVINTGYPFYEEYIESIREVYDRSDFPVLVYGRVGDKFDDRFPEERIVRSASFINKRVPEDRGEVCPEDWGKFIDILKEGDQYRIHGSFFGKCVDHFAAQLFGYLGRNEHWHDWWGHGDKKDIEEEVKLLIEHEIQGEVVNSGIRYGTVLAPPDDIEVQTPSPLRKLFGRYTFGDYNYQMMDEQTKIFYSEGVKYVWDPFFR